MVVTKFIYVLRSGKSHYKVGVTRDVLKRIKGLQTGNQHCIELVIARPVSNAQKAEKQLHNLLANSRARGGTEWFELTTEEALELIIKVSSIEASADLADHLAIRGLSARQSILENSAKRIESSVDKIFQQLPKTTTAPYPADFQEHKSTQELLYNEAVVVVRAADRASASLLQRRLRIGYARAASLIDMLEENQVIGSAKGQGSLARQVL